MKTVVGSYSEIDTARQCEFKHELGYKERWRSPSTGPALAKGTLFHLVMQAHYESLMATQPNNNGGVTTMDATRLDLAVAAATGVLQRELDAGTDAEIVDLVNWMYGGYIEHYGVDPQWEILAVETNYQVWLPTPKGTKSRFKLKIKIDLVVRQDGRIWIVDHKTGKDLPTEKMLQIEDQFTLYTYGLRTLGKNVFGSLHNAVRTQRNKDQARNPQTLESRMLRTRLTRTDAELDSVAVDAYRTLRAAHSIPVNEAPRSTNSDTCRWRCDFTEACLFGRKGFDHRQMLTDMGFVQDFTRH